MKYQIGDKVEFDMADGTVKVGIVGMFFGGKYMVNVGEYQTFSISEGELRPHRG